MAEHWTRLALAITETLELRPHHRVLRIDLVARAWAYLGNSLRIQSRFSEARESLDRAALLLEHGSGDPLELGHLLDFRASLFFAQGQLDQAESATRRAIAIYSRAGDEELVGRSLIKEAMICRDRNQPHRGVPVLRRAERLLGKTSEPRLLLCVKHNLLLMLLESGQLEEADRLLPQVRKLALAAGSPLDLVRLKWVCGVAARSRGYLDRAESYLIDARRGFLQAKLPIEVAQASLDLAVLYCEQGRFAETRELVGDVLPAFEALGVTVDALASRLLLAAASERQAVTVATLHEAAALLKKAAGAGLRPA